MTYEYLTYDDLPEETPVEKICKGIIIPLGTPTQTERLTAKVLLTQEKQEALKQLDKRTLKRGLARDGEHNPRLAHAFIDLLYTNKIINQLEHYEWTMQSSMPYKS